MGNFGFLCSTLLNCNSMRMSCRRFGPPLCFQGIELSTLALKLTPDCEFFENVTTVSELGTLSELKLLLI